jgi:hypothetical protein
MLIRILASDLKSMGFQKGAGGRWYNPQGSSDSSDLHVHLGGKNHTPDYDPVKNPNAPDVLDVEFVEIKVNQGHRWFGERDDADGKFTFNTATISGWGTDKAKAEDLLKKVPAQLKK